MRDVALYPVLLLIACVIGLMIVLNACEYKDNHCKGKSITYCAGKYLKEVSGDLKAGWREK